MKITALCENHLFSKAYSKGKRAVSESLAVYLLPDYTAKRRYAENPRKRPDNRVGITVSKKLGSAVERNRMKRIIREAYRALFAAGELKHGFLLVIAARERALSKKSTEILPELRRNLKKLDLLL